MHLEELKAVTFVEMPQMADWCASQRQAAADHGQAWFDSRRMMRVCGYELYIGDGFMEQTLQS